MNLTTTLYLHGGPGFNGQPERELLTGTFRDRGYDLRVWDEPSAQRPDGPRFEKTRAFQNLLDRAEDFLLENTQDGSVVLMAHSFGAFAACHLARMHPGRIRHLIFVSPDLCPSVADRNLFTTVMLDFRARGDALHLELQKVLDRYSGTFDTNTEAGFELAARNPRMFEAYWTQRDRMTEFLPYYAQKGYTIDLQALKAVRRTVTPIHMTNNPTRIAVVFGENEVIVSRAMELGVLRGYFSNLAVYTVRDAAHYPHVEQPSDFLDLMGKVLGTAGDRE